MLMDVFSSVYGVPTKLTIIRHLDSYQNQMNYLAIM